MSDPIILGKITLYAREVVLDDKTTKAFAVAMYSLGGNKCRIPFNQTPEKIEATLFVRPGDPNAPFPPVKGKESNGECGVAPSFLRYDLDDRVFWVVVNKAGVPYPRLQGMLSEILRQPIA